MSVNVTRDLVLRKVAILFPDPAIAAQTLESLENYGNKDHERLRHLVHLAILKLSEGKLWRLRELVHQAKRDFRDVLYPAQEPEYFRRVVNPDWQRERYRLGLTDTSRSKSNLSEAEEAAIRKRDRDQWSAWLSLDSSRVSD